MNRSAMFLIGALFTAAGLTPAQEGQAPKPGKEHALLKQFEGSWDFTSRFLNMANGESTTSKGKETARIIAGGLFLVFDVEGDMGGQKFIGHGTLGYDLHKKKYTGSWVDSMGTAHYTVEATCDEAGKKWTEWMEGPDPATGQPFKMKLTHEIKSKDSRRSAFFLVGPESKEIELGTLEYTRKK